jgi:2-dehydro-3-deoxyphosphogluconate aldolase/(4S)-4-hydroxy-2-oxoglutarate aldolase
VNTDERITQYLRNARAVPVLRCAGAEEAVLAGEALIEGGLNVIEVAYTTPGATEAIRHLASTPGRVVGAGTVLTPDDARRAANAGAGFLVTPVWLPWLTQAARDLGVAAVPGAATPSEIWHAHSSGAAVVKVFPIARLGGAAYIKDLMAPLPELRLMATGGVTVATAKELLAAGCIAVGLGSAHTDPALGDTVVDRARRVREQLATKDGIE